MGVSERIPEEEATQPGSSGAQKEKNSQRLVSDPSVEKTIDSHKSSTTRQVSAGLELADSDFNRAVTNASVMSYMSMDVVEARWEALLSMIEVERDARIANHRELSAALDELQASPRRCEQQSLFDEFRVEIEEKLVAIGATCDDHIEERFSQFKAQSVAKVSMEEMEAKLAEVEAKINGQLASTLKLVDDTLENRVAQIFSRDSVDNFREEIQDKFSEAETRIHDRLDSTLNLLEDALHMLAGTTVQSKKNDDTTHSASGNTEERLTNLVADSVDQSKKDDEATHSARKTVVEHAKALADALTPSRKKGSVSLRVSLSPNQSLERAYADNAIYKRSASTPYISATSQDSCNMDSAQGRQSPSGFGRAGVMIRPAKQIIVPHSQPLQTGTPRLHLVARTPLAPPPHVFSPTIR